VQPGATLSPGASIGTLTINNTLNLAAGSRTLAEVNAGNGSSDLVAGLSSITYGGTLMVSNHGGTVTGNQTFQLFSASSKSGNFAAISPASPGPGLTWYFNPTNGFLTAQITVALTPTNLAVSSNGTNLTLSWPADHLGWALWEQTNALYRGLSTNPQDWRVYPGSAATNLIIIPIQQAKPAMFYRLGY
jgi:hypothetical protein